MRVLKRRFRGLSWRPRATAVAFFFIAALSALPAPGGEGDGRLSLRVGGGAGFLGWGDVESLKGSYKNQILYAASRLGIETAGSCGGDPLTDLNVLKNNRVLVLHNGRVAFSRLTSGSVFRKWIP